MEHLEMDLHLWHDNVKMDVEESCFDFRLNSSIPHGWGGWRSRIFGKANAIILHESGKNIKKFCT